MVARIVLEFIQNRAQTADPANASTTNVLRQSNANVKIKECCLLKGALKYSVCTILFSESGPRPTQFRSANSEDDNGNDPGRDKMKRFNFLEDEASVSQTTSSNGTTLHP